MHELHAYSYKSLDLSKSLSKLYEPLRDKAAKTKYSFHKVLPLQMTHFVIFSVQNHPKKQGFPRNLSTLG